jgi:hypothetical protein
VAATSHAAIHNPLREVERFAGPGPRWRGLKKESGSPESRYASVHEPVLIGNSSDVDELADGEYALVAGTAWLFAREELDGRLDYCSSTRPDRSRSPTRSRWARARNLVLLGDPLQLAQVSQATHPPGAGASVLEHLLAGRATVPRDRGLFIEETRRMHPEVCRFVSEVVYEGSCTRGGSARSATARASASRPRAS